MILDRDGTFRGRFVESAVNQTKNGFPQFVGRLLLTEWYDEEAGEWVPWEEYSMETVAYLVLASNKGPCLNYDQLQAALGWDGESFADLDSKDWSSVTVQVRVAENDWEQGARYRVEWIDTCEADPLGGRGIKRLDKNEVKSLDRWLKGVKRPQARKATSSAEPPATPPRTQTRPGPKPPAEPKPEPPAEPKPEPPARKGAKKDTSAELATGLPAECSKEDAWAKVIELRTDEASDEMVAEAWVEACDKVAPDKDESDFTAEEWAQVRDITLDSIPSLPF